MAQLIIRGAVVNQISAYLSTNGIVTTEVEIHADWTDTVCEALGWDEHPRGVGKAEVGEPLFAQVLHLTPNKNGLKQHRVKLSVNRTEKFKYVPTKDKEGNPNGAELRFTVTSTAKDAIITMDNWLRNVQDTDKSQCKLLYSEEVQPTLPGVAEPPADTKAGKAAAN